MPASKAQQKAVSKYMKANYDVFQVRMPKGKKEVIQAHAQSQGESVNKFICRSIDQALKAEPSETALKGPVSLPFVQGVVLPPEALKAAEEASAATKEPLEGFVARAVEEQAKRDGISWRMGINPATGEKIAKKG